MWKSLQEASVSRLLTTRSVLSKKDLQDSLEKVARHEINCLDEGRKLSQVQERARDQEAAGLASSLKDPAGTLEPLEPVIVAAELTKVDVGGSVSRWDIEGSITSPFQLFYYQIQGAIAIIISFTVTDSSV